MLSSPLSTPVNYALPIVSPTNVQAVEQTTTTRLINVLHVINGEHFSGAERVQQLLGQCLPEYGVMPTFACVKPGKFIDLCGLPETQLLRTPMRSRIDLRVVSQLAHVVRANDFHILHAHTPRTALLTSMVSMRTGVPWCYHVHSPTARDSTRGVVNKINSWIERYSINSCAQLVTVSESLRRESLKLGVKRERLSLVPNGVPNIEPIETSPRLTSAKWRLGLIALMRPRKGIEVALEAMKLINQTGRKVELELIGGFETDTYERHVLDVIERLQLTSFVRWTGFTTDIASAIRRLDALVLPSLFGEGMPMVVLEALAAGVPVVATAVEGTPEVIRHGVEGMLAQPGCAISLAEQIEQLIADRSTWAMMSARAVVRHREHFSAQLMAKRVAEVYHRMLDV